MAWKRLLTICGAVMSIPLTLAVGAVLAYEVNLHVLMNRAVDSVGPGDAMGMILLAAFFGGSQTILALLAWERLYRKIPR